jgi:hypothetical protein
MVERRCKKSECLGWRPKVLDGTLLYALSCALSFLVASIPISSACFCVLILVPGSDFTRATSSLQNAITSVVAVDALPMAPRIGTNSPILTAMSPALRLMLFAYRHRDTENTLWTWPYRDNEFWASDRSSERDMATLQLRAISSTDPWDVSKPHGGTNRSCRCLFDKEGRWRCGGVLAGEKIRYASSAVGPDLQAG